MKTLVEQCQKVNINKLLREVEIESRMMRLQAKIEALGINIRITTTPCYFGGARQWFLCPNCERRVATLYKPPTKDELMCRKCHDLQYLKSRYGGMIESD
jgi:hypothetical protein